MNSTVYQRKIENEAEQFMRDRVAKALEQCTSEQQSLFHKMYPNGPRSAQLSWAYAQCMKTIERNAEKQ